LDGLPEEVRGKMLARINMLKEHGPTLEHPYTSQIEGKLREVRLRFGKIRYRVLYFFDEKRVAILLHGLTKDTEKLEESDKRIGQDRMAKHVRRINEEKAKDKTRIEPKRQGPKKK
jgi:phage-related protein